MDEKANADLQTDLKVVTDKLNALYATLLAAMLANRYLRFQNGAGELFRDSAPGAGCDCSVYGVSVGVCQGAAYVRPAHPCSAWNYFYGGDGVATPGVFGEPPLVGAGRRSPPELSPLGVRFHLTGPWYLSSQSKTSFTMSS